MNRFTFRHLVLGLIAAPLALGLAACGKSDVSGEKPSSEPIAAIAPPEGKSWTEVVSETQEGGYRMGNPDAPIKLVEFGSLTCPHCAEFAEQSGEELHNNFVASGRVSVEFRNFVRDPIDLTAAQLTRCGSAESFFALTDQAFANQASMIENLQKAGDDAYGAAIALPDDQRGIALARLTGLDEFFAARGIARDQANACLADSAAARALAEATSRQGEEYDITGTPSFLINGQKVNINTWPELKARLENLGAR